MSIKAKYNQPAKVVDVALFKTEIDWNSKKLNFRFSNGENCEVKMNKGKLVAITKLLKPDIENIPNISEIEIPDFDPDME